MRSLERTRRHRLAVLLLSRHADEAHLRGLLEAGADGYLLKEAAAPELPAAVHAALNGSMQRVADRVFLLTPHNVEVSAEERARVLERGGFFNQA